MSWVYVFWGDADRALYVGMTDNPRRRFNEHRLRASWWAEVRGATLYPFASRALARTAEHGEIARLDPAHNVMRLSSWPERVTAAIARPTGVAA